MKNFDYDFSQKNANKAFLSKLQAERQQRLLTKKAQSSALLILSYYRQTRVYSSLSTPISNEILNKTRDLKKLEPVLKENYPNILQKALEKYQILKVLMLVNYRNGEKHIEFLSNICYFHNILSQKGLALSNDDHKLTAYKKHLILGILGVVSRGNQSKDFRFFLTNTKGIFKNIEIDVRIVLKLLKNQDFSDFWSIVLKKLFKPWVLKSRREILREILTIRGGVYTLLNRKVAIHTFEEFIEEAKTILMKNLTKDKYEISGILLENLKGLLIKGPILDSNPIEVQFMFLKFMEVFTVTLEILLGKGSNSSIEEEKNMEIEESNHLDPLFDFSAFFSGRFLEFIGEVFSEEIKRNTPIMRISDLVAIQSISKTFSMILSIKSQEKTRYMLAMSQTQQFLMKMFEVIEFFASFGDLKKQNLDLFSYILALFARIYLQKIEIMDHAEFFSLNLESFADKPSFIRNFPMEKVEFLSQFLVNFAYRAFFQQNETLECKSPILKLLNSLYFRHCQKNFAGNPRFWQIPQANEFSYHNSMIFSQLPFIFPFEKRLLKLKEMITDDQSLYKRDDFMDLASISIRRGFELDDAVAEMKMKKIQWKDRFRVKYINSQGIEEIGIDGGGMFKEFLTVITRYFC